MSTLPAQYIWHTAPESHAKVQEVNFGGSPCWHVWLPSGTMEEFGCTNEARQSAKDALGNFTAYRWDLDLIVDRYGNQVRVHYKQNYPAGGNVRDAVISSVEYDDPSCHNTTFTNATAQCASWHPQVTLVFDSAMKVANQTNTTSCQSWTSTTFRCDDPVDLSGSGGLPIANAQSTYALNDIKVQINGNLLREYRFSYDQGGPQTIVDPYSGQNESAAGYLNLTKIEQLGTNGNLLNAPVTTMSYTQQTQHYVDKNHQTNPKSTCGPSWTPTNANGCVLWEQSYNSYYLTTLDNGMGWNVTMSWQEAHNNTHGTVGNNPFTCNAPGAQTPTSLCGEADDQNWSRIVLTQRVEKTNGVSSTWTYQYSLNAFSAQQCSDCLWGYTWGNQNDDDYSDYYNGQFTSFAHVQVTNPDASSQIDYFASTPGWGLATSSITCFTTAPCHAAPYWNLDPGGSGRLKSAEDFGPDGKLLQVMTNTYAMNCPPTGVSNSANSGGPTVDPGGQYMISQLDHNNPVVVCDPRVTQVDTYKVDGVTDLNGYLSDARVVHTTVNTTYDGNNQGVSAYDYGNVSKVDTTGNDVGGLHFVQASTYYPNDNLGSNVYLTNLPAFAQDLDGSGTSFGCTAFIYGANTTTSQAPTTPEVTKQAEYVQQHAGCTSTTVMTQHTYDSSGNPITAIDGDEHLGCALAGSTTQYSACATYDGFATHLTHALNAKNQSVAYLYNATLASTGFGQWLMGTTDANGQTTTYGYDTLGRLTSIVQPGDSQADPTTSYTYTNTCTPGSTTPCLELDTTTRVTSGGNTATTTKQWYDGMGRLVETQSPGPNLFSKVPAIGSMLVTYTIYDNMGRATTQSLPYAIAASSTIRYAAPDLNQARTTTNYDGLGRPLGSVSYGIGVVILSESTISYTVGQGLPSFTTDTSTPFEQTITLDAYNHQQVEYTDALGRDHYEQVFSGTGSPYTVIRTVQYNRDEVGNVTSTVTFDAKSKAQATRSSTYDGLKRVTGWNDSDQGSCANTPLPTSCSSSSDTAWKVTYDADGNQLSQADPRKMSTYTSYDALDRPLCRGTASSQVNPCQSSAYTTFFYDSYNNSSNSSVTFPSGCVAPGGTSAPVGQKVAETFSSAAGTGWRCMGYDARGQTTAGVLSVTADGRTTIQSVSMTYNDLGTINSLTYPDGETVTSQYDSNGRLRSAYFGTSSSSNPVAFLSGQVSYINSGQLAGLSVGGTANTTSVPTAVFSTSLSYDGMQRPVSSSATRTGASSPFWSQQRTFDNAGNILQLSTTLPTVSGASSKTDTQSFCYDALDRLTWAGNTGTPSGGDHCGLTPSGSTTSGYSQSFSYDALGRITSGSAGTMTYGDSSHVHAATGLSSVSNPYASYDAMGNMTCRNVSHSSSQSCASGAQTGAIMTYDNEGRLASWKAPQGSTGTDQFLYDNEGNRVLQRSSTSSVSDTITFDGYSEVVITGGTSTITNYFSVAGQRVAMRKGAILSYLLPDFLGSSSVALNNDGSTQAVQLYAPYGSARYSDQVMPIDYSFTGQRLDSQTGLLYDNARYYDPVSGRFISSDMVQNNTKGLDSYAYVGDNPESRTDPSGKCWPVCAITAVVGAVTGAVVGIVGEAAVHGTDLGHYNWGHVAVNAGVGAVAGFMIGTGVGAAVGIGMITGGATSAIGAAASHQSFAEGLQTTFEGATIGGIMGGLTAGMGAEFELGGSQLGRTVGQRVVRALGQGVIQAAGGIVGDTYTQFWNSWRDGNSLSRSFNGGEVIEAGLLSFGGGFLGQWAYDNWPVFQTGATYTSRMARQVQRDENWAAQSDAANIISGGSQGIVQAIQSTAPTSNSYDQQVRRLIQINGYY
jgi:RHS repeat-associated protein